MSVFFCAHSCHNIIFRQFLLNENNQQNTYDDVTSDQRKIDDHQDGHLAPVGRPRVTVDDSELDNRMTRVDDPSARISRFDRYKVMVHKDDYA